MMMEIKTMIAWGSHTVEDYIEYRRKISVVMIIFYILIEV